jgi:anti-anti-sigma factor
LRDVFGKLQTREEPTSQLVLDLTDVPFMDSASVGLIVSQMSWIAARGSSLSVMCSPYVFRILRIVGLVEPLRAIEGTDKARLRPWGQTSLESAP